MAATAAMERLPAVVALVAFVVLAILATLHFKKALIALVRLVIRPKTRKLYLVFLRSWKHILLILLIFVF